MEASDVVIVGGGIAGTALANALAGDGLSVVVLEASHEYHDRVRGESMLPWGVLEARRLGVEQTLLGAGAHVASEWVHYDGSLPASAAEANPLPVGMMVPGVPGSLNLRHPEACAALAAAATGAGARILRGVMDVTITPGPEPRVGFTTEAGGSEEIRTRLIVGADGRNSTVRKQAGIPLNHQEARHMIAGLLVEGLDEVPAERDFLAGEDELFMASFHQGGGRLRMYLCPGLEQRHRFSGRGGVEEFLRSAAFRCLPFGEALAHARPCGPLATYPGDDSWTDEPYVEGVALIGDAAGYNNPIIGQGLSIALRDARTVRDVVAGGDLTPAAFAPYAAERHERMRRLRMAANFMGAVFGEDGDNRAARRAKFLELQTNEPLMLGLLGGMFAGPENGPPEAFDGHLEELVRATPSPAPVG